MALLARCGDEEDCGEEHASVLDQAQLQRSGVSAITHIRCLGHGAYAAVDLVSMRVGAARKLLVSKRLQQQTQTLRPSSQADWEREASMHRACAGCPFVLQLLAAKRCRSGELLLLTEYASRGSITQLMARTRAAAALASSITSSRGGITSSGDAVLCAVRATPACSGGLSEASTQFVAACVLMALQWMHERRMLHRDVKPCNVLLFRDGYVKLGDLGCCCVLPPGMHARTRTGTAAYLAPEVAGGDTPYGAAVDMWSLGVTLWEMAAGALPRWAADEGASQQQQLPAPRAPLEFPAHFSQELQQLLRGLLADESRQRFDIQQAMAAPFFDGFNWAGLQDRTLVPPPYA